MDALGLLIVLPAVLSFVTPLLFDVAAWLLRRSKPTGDE
jgi:hypothetical protein